MLEHPSPVEYTGIKLDCGSPIDIPAENRLIIDVKYKYSVSSVLSVVCLEHDHCDVTVIMI